MASFLASGVDMDGFIKDVAATIDATKAHLKSAHDVYISFDEWNVWYQGEEPSQTPEGIGNWPVAPASAGGHLHRRRRRGVRRSDDHAAQERRPRARRRLAQLCNLIARSDEPGGPGGARPRSPVLRDRAPGQGRHRCGA